MQMVGLEHDRWPRGMTMEQAYSIVVFRVELTQEGAVGLRSEQQARLAETEQCT